MKTQVMQNNSKTSREFLDKTGTGTEQRDHYSYDLDVNEFEEIIVNRCGNCNSQRIQVMGRYVTKRIRCHECGNDEWN